MPKKAQAMVAHRADLRVNRMDAMTSLSHRVLFTISGSAVTIMLTRGRATRIIRIRLSPEKMMLKFYSPA